MATPSKVAKRKEYISKLGQQKPAQCRNRQIQQQGAVPAAYKIHLKQVGAPTVPSAVI
jgi:hypothetical protein